MSYFREDKFQSYTYKDKLVDYTSKIAKINFIYFMFIFAVISILFISFFFISFPKFWFSTSYADPFFFAVFHTTLRTLGIVLAILTIPGLTCIVLRFMYFFQLRSALEELSYAQPVVRPSVKRAADFLIIGVFGEIVSFLVVPLLGNLIGGIMVMYSFNTIDQILRELKIQGLYSGEENKLLFYSYLGLVVILPITGVLTCILVSVTQGIPGLAIILASIFMLVLIVSTILHLQGFRKLTQNFRGLQVFQPVSPTAEYTPPQKPIAEPLPAKQPIPMIEEHTEFKYCSNCGHKLEQHSKFCSECGAVQ